MKVCWTGENMERIEVITDGPTRESIRARFTDSLEQIEREAVAAIEAIEDGRYRFESLTEDRDFLTSTERS
jgi:hypothetical protein